MKNAAEPPESEQAFTSEFDEGDLEAELYHSSMTSESSCSCESCASSNYTSCSCCNEANDAYDDDEDCLGDQSEELMSSLMTTSTGSNVTIVEQGSPQSLFYKIF